MFNHQRACELQHIGDDGQNTAKNPGAPKQCPEALYCLFLWVGIRGLVAPAELHISVFGFLLWLEFEKIVHLKGFLSALFHEMVCPDEENLGEEVGLVLNTWLELNLTVNLVRFLLFH